MAQRPSLWVVGAGGLGREVLMFARDVIAAGGTDWVIGGLLDDHPGALAQYAVGADLRGPIDGFEITADKRFVLAFGAPETRLGVAARLARRGAQFASVIHPTAIVGERSTCGVGSVLAIHATVSCDSAVGDHVSIGFRSAIGHDVTVGAGSVLTGFCVVNGGGSIGEGVFLGSHTVVLPGVWLGDGAKTAAGAVVMRNVPAKTMVGGNPARVMSTF